MVGQPGPAPLPQAGAHRRRRIPLVWIVPALTAAIALWLAWDTFSKRGPTITISFDAAAGLQAGQSQLKFKDVVMGTVKTVVVAPDLSKVLVTVETVAEAKPLLTDKTIFWIVKPGIFAGNLTGLDTLLSGAYIGMMPTTDKEKGKEERSFVGKQDPPILQTVVPGTTFMLDTHRLGSIGLGAPIFYRDFEVGTVLGWDLSHMARHVTIHAFVRAPFDKYVREDSHFWNASGISFKLGSNGVEIKLESFKALLLGGIAFATQPVTKSPVAAAGTHFPLYANRDAATSAGFGRIMKLKSNFSGSVAGLAAGADVTLHGLKIGEVSDVALVYNPKVDHIQAVVQYQVQADRIAGAAVIQGVPLGTVAGQMVKRGFRATLQSTSLISPGKVLAIELSPGAPPAEMEQDGDVFIIPSAEGGGFDSITRSASDVLAKINSIDFAAIGAGLGGLIKGLDDTVNGPQMKKTLTSLELAMADIQDVARKLDAGATPAFARLPEISVQLQDSLTKANRLIGSINAGYGENSKFHRDLDRLLPQLTDTARSIRALTDLLSRHPEALIKGRTNTGKE